MNIKPIYVVIGFLLATIIGVFIIYYVNQNPLTKENFEPLDNVSQSSSTITYIDELIIPNPEKHEKASIEYFSRINEQNKKYREALKKIPKEVRLKAAKEAIKPLQKFSETQINSFNIDGKIVDQFDNPVDDAIVEYYGTDWGLAEGSGANSIVTNIAGEFNIKDVKGKKLVINKVFKLGYQFPKIFEGITPLNQSKFSIDKYEIKAWKIGKYPLIKEGDLSLGFIPNVQNYTIDLLSKDNPLRKGANNGDFFVEFYRTSVDWEFRISSVNGGIIETSDSYRYEAPAEGYQKKIVVSGSKLKSYAVTKSFYFYNEKNNYYGTIKAEIWPYHNDEQSALFIDYVINLEQGRNLTIKD